MAEASGSAPAVAETPVPVSGRKAAASVPSSEPVLDLSIPGVVSSSQPVPEQSQERDQSDRFPKDVTGATASDPRTAQVMRLKCEVEIQQLCPNVAEGPERARCLERRAKDLPAPCQNHLRERFVKWKEDRSRRMTACQEDVKRLCGMIRPSDGRVMQCLQEHAQEVSDRCYETLPKGRLLFRQQ